MCLKSCLLADRYLVRDEDSQTQLASQKILKSIKCPQRALSSIPLLGCPLISVIWWS